MVYQYDIELVMRNGTDRTEQICQSQEWAYSPTDALLQASVNTESRLGPPWHVDRCIRIGPAQIEIDKALAQAQTLEEIVRRFAKEPTP
jgi:hypothetical protein